MWKETGARRELRSTSHNTICTNPKPAAACPVEVEGLGTLRGREDDGTRGGNLREGCVPMVKKTHEPSAYTLILILYIETSQLKCDVNCMF
ncbi:hypothetical protein VZT92_023752 [Zoarces viviparus]|uniref:Uncharacterized protein n=1 Tax=Zoarces viviparus TaxID=48416 RepID=A0AAW1E7H7_ZOAVI